MVAAKPTVLLLFPLAMSLQCCTDPAESLQQQPQQRSFYQRPLPDTCTSFTSKRGKDFFRSALHHSGLRAFYALIEQHSTQTEPAFCGLSTLVICLNALAVDPRRSWRSSPWRWYDENMLNCCVSLEAIRTTGITLMQFHCLATCQGLRSSLRYAEEQNEADFRAAVRAVCVEPTVDENTATAAQEEEEEEGPLKKVLAVSYARQVLGQTGTGHFSPVGAFDPVSDQVLILDTARFKYGAHWVPLPLLVQAMLPIDPDTKRSRGWVTLEPAVRTAYENDAKALRQSFLLFHPPMQQVEARRKFKSYLDGLGNDSEPLLEDVANICSRHGQDVSRVWNMTQVQLLPTEAGPSNVTVTLVAQMGEILNQLLHKHVSHTSPLAPFLLGNSTVVPMDECRPDYSRTFDINAPQVIALFYLAALLEPSRRQAVWSATSSFSNDTTTLSSEAAEQLLVEAQVLRAVIDVSDSADLQSSGIDEANICQGL